MRKVLEIINGLTIGGTEMFVMNYYRNIDRENLTIDFLVFTDENTIFTDEIKKSGDKIFVCNKRSVISKMMYIVSLLKRKKYDVVHSHACQISFLIYTCLPAKIAKVRTVISHSHSVGTPKNTSIDTLIRNILKWILSNCVDYGFACSKMSGQNKYTKRLINSKKYNVIPNAIDTIRYKFDKESRYRIRDEYNIDESCKIIGTVGRLSHEKNHEYLIDVFHKLSLQNTSFHLFIIGDGELREYLYKKCVELGIINRVHFPGNVNNTQDYYSAMDVFVMTSIYEGFPFTVVEAQSNGLKCILSNNISEEVDITKQNRFLPLCNNTTTWIEEILKLSKSRCTNKEIEIVRKRYDIVSCAKELRNYYVGDT